MSKLVRVHQLMLMINSGLYAI